MFEDEHLDAQEYYGSKAFETKEDRLGFVRKVYSILGIQILITALLTLAPRESYSVRLWMVNHQWLLWVSLAFALVIELALVCARKLSKTVPYNYICLFLFTLCEAYIVSFICAFSDSTIVLIAAFMTAAMVMSLSIYAMFTKSDFTIYTGLLCVVGVTMFFFAFFVIIFHNRILDIVWCALCVIIFGIYLIYDTQLIMGGKRLALDIDEYILGALILYIDIITIFLYILMLLSRSRS